MIIFLDAEPKVPDKTGDDAVPLNVNFLRSGSKINL